MSKYIIESLNQKFEIKGYRVYFNIQNSVHAEEILNSLDKATPQLEQLFCLDAPPEAEIFIYPDTSTIERVSQRPMAVGETFRILAEESAVMLSDPQLTKMPGIDTVRNICYMLFDNAVKEREIDLKTYRTPSWLRDGICLQIPSKLRTDSKDYLVGGWKICKEAFRADQLIKPSVMVRSLYLISDPNRRELAIHQSFFMARYFLSNFSNKFFKKYSTLMGAFEDMESETAFRQITSLNFEKFFNLFKDWVRTTNVWAAISD